MAKPVSEVLAENLERLKRERKKDLGSQPRIAGKANLGQRTVGRALKGEVSTTIGSIERLAGAFGLETWELLHPDLNRAPGPAHVAEEGRPYRVDQTTQAKLLEYFDKLTPKQQRTFLSTLHDAAQGNLDVARHLSNRAVTEK